jgi:integrase
MGCKLTDRIVKSLPLPKQGNRISYDSEVAGFGARVTSGGSRAFILNYYTRIGRERRVTIGQFPDWSTVAARQEAKALKQRIDRGEDPLAELEAGREAKSVADLCHRFLTEHSARKNRASTQKDYASVVNRWILPKLKHRKAAEVTFSDIDDLHAIVTKEGGPYVANRMVAVLSKAFNLAIRWKWRTDNPARGIERNDEVKRERYLSTAEIDALSKALNKHSDQQAANIIRLLLLTGARKGEVLNARWDQFDLDSGIWTKPGATTKQKTTHRVPLSAPAWELLTELLAAEKAAAKKAQRELSVWVFPGRFDGAPRENVRRPWREICQTAGFTAHTRVHDLRHTYASLLASSGKSLSIIGRLLGHTQASTTKRYSHLQDDPLRAATEVVGTIVGNGNGDQARHR